MQEFAAHQRNVRKIKIVYGQEKGVDARNRDWVYLMHSCFEGLEEVGFEIGGKGILGFAAWWGCVREAVREGWCCRERKGDSLVVRCEVGGKEVVREFVKG